MFRQGGQGRLGQDDPGARAAVAHCFGQQLVAGRGLGQRAGRVAFRQLGRCRLIAGIGLVDRIAAAGLAGLGVRQRLGGLRDRIECRLGRGAGAGDALLGHRQLVKQRHRRGTGGAHGGDARAQRVAPGDQWPQRRRFLAEALGRGAGGLVFEHGRVHGRLRGGDRPLLGLGQPLRVGARLA